MSAAISGICSPACRFAHAGYDPTVTNLLALPHDAGEPQIILARERAVGELARAEAPQLDRLHGLADELAHDHLAAAQLDHHAVAAPNRGRGRDDDQGAVAIDRAQRVAGDLQRIGVAVLDRREAELVPAVAVGKAALVEMPAFAGFGEAH